MKCAILLSVLFALFAMTPAFADDSGQALNLVFPAQSTFSQPVTVKFSLDGSILKAHFEVHTPTIHGQPHLGPGQYPFQWDVVEVFVSVSPTSGVPFPYYEIELSPYDQDFEVKIEDLKKPFTNGVQIGIEHSVMMIPQGWIGEMSIPLSNLGWDGDPSHIQGNAFAVLGQSPHRSYFSLFLPAETKPNFHRPEFFKPLPLPTIDP
jgi:hypothetical protein